MLIDVPVNSVVRGKSAFLEAFQTFKATVQNLLALKTFPGLSDEDMVRFRRFYTTTAHFCRQYGYARTFRNDALRKEHEDLHKRVSSSLQRNGSSELSSPPADASELRLPTRYRDVILWQAPDLKWANAKVLLSSPSNVVI
jgi:hypothetical protein